VAFPTNDMSHGVHRSQTVLEIAANAKTQQMQQ